MTEHNNVTISRELLRQVLSSMDMMLNSGEWYCAQERADALREALDAPAVEPVAWAYLFDDDGSLCQTFDTQDEAEKWAGSDDNMWSGYIAPLFTAPQAQQPPRNGPSMTVEQALEQWEHYFKNPMTPEQQADWVKREREFASAQAQQPAPDTDIPDLIAGTLGVSRGTAYDLMREALEAQQPRKAVKLTNEELVDHYCAIADGKEWAIGGLSDAVPFARAIEQTVWEKLGVTE